MSSGMRDYKGWTHAQRMASLYKTKKAIAQGIIPPPTVCNRCGQTEGLIDYHNHDYSDPIIFLEPLCYRCHMVLHCEYRAPEICMKYWTEIDSGKRWPPIYTRNFAVIRKDHGL